MLNYRNENISHTLVVNITGAISFKSNIVVDKEKCSTSNENKKIYDDDRRFL